MDASERKPKESRIERTKPRWTERTRYAVDPDEYKAILRTLERPAKARPELIDLFQRSRPR